MGVIIMLELYLFYLQESKLITKNPNAPCAAYETVYGKKCLHIRGRYVGVHKTRNWKGIEVDEHLKNKWLDNLSNIKEIEMRSSCEGHEADWVTFIIFRLTDKSKESNKSILNKIIHKLEASDKITKASWSFGMQGRPRIVVAAKTWYGQPEWENWWNTLATRIKKVLK